jgi:hypothetical protein
MHLHKVLKDRRPGKFPLDTAHSFLGGDEKLHLMEYLRDTFFNRVIWVGRGMLGGMVGLPLYCALILGLTL